MTNVPFGVLLFRGFDSSLMNVVTSQQLNDIQVANV
jgi:hypothetical protein